MRKFMSIAAALAAISFVGGLVWGHWSKLHQAQQLSGGPPLRVLCGENWLPQGTLETFSHARGVRIEEYTYRTPEDFLRQMANADGNVDVICANSLIVRSLVRSHWLKKANLDSLPNFKQISVDFTHLPFDPQDEYTVPLFWNLYGFFGKGNVPRSTWRQTWAAGRIALWADELNVLYLMNVLNLNAGERLVPDQKTESISLAFKKFTKVGLRFLKPDTNSLASAVDQSSWLEVPVSRVGALLGKGSPYRFWLPEDGATIEVGTLAVGEKSTEPELAAALINELISPDSAAVTHAQMGAGVVHRSLNGLASVSELQKAEALRLFPLNRLRFPDVDVQDIPHFQKVFLESIRN